MTELIDERKTSMSRKNTYDGLRFRIMETLEQAKGVPLTAREIATRLHETEYRFELADNVAFKVTKAVHAMKELGQIVVTDARDRDGRLTYALPQRMLFPRKENAVPHNPVLTADIAEKIITTEPVPEPKVTTARGKHRVEVMCAGVADRIEKILDQSPRPMSAKEIEAIADKQNWWTDGGNVTQRIAGNIFTLCKNKRVFRIPAPKGTGQGTKYIYATRKTGKGVAPTKPEPTLVEPVVETPAPASSVVFRPIAKPPVETSITLNVTETFLNQIEYAAKKFEVSVEDFCRQAIDFAMSHTE